MEHDLLPTIAPRESLTESASPPARTLGGSNGPGADASRPDREDAIRQAAYFLYEARGGAPGLEVEDWLHAEAQLKQSGDKSGARHAEGMSSLAELTTAAH